MPKAIRIAKTAIDDVISTFNDLPAKSPSDYTLKEAISQILPAINDLTKRGYNLDEVSKLLAQKEIAITSSTLKQYIRDFGKSKLKQSRPKQLAISSSSPSSSSSLPVSTPVESQVFTPVESQVEPTPSPTKPAKSDKASKVSEDPVTEQPYKSPPKPGA
jgi:hypothetical protein